MKRTNDYALNDISNISLNGGKINNILIAKSIDKSASLFSAVIITF